MIDKDRRRLNSKGTGLGLAIAKKIVESLGGTITLKSKVDVGTKILFTIKEAVRQNLLVDKEEVKYQTLPPTESQLFKFELPPISEEEIIINKISIFDLPQSSEKLFRPTKRIHSFKMNNKI